SDSAINGRGIGEEVRRMMASGALAGAPCAPVNRQIGQLESSEQQSSAHSKAQPKGPTISVRAIPSTAVQTSSRDLPGSAFTQSHETTVRAQCQGCFRLHELVVGR